MYWWEDENVEIEIKEILKEAKLDIKISKNSDIESYLSCINIKKEKKRVEKGITVNNEDKFLEMLVKDYKIFIDTCSLVMEESCIFFKKLEKILGKYNKQVYVPLSVIKEIDKIIGDKKDKSKYMINGKSILLKYQKKNLLCILDDKGQNFADNVFTTIFTIHRLNHNLCLITQDRGLTRDILNLYKSSSVKVKKDVQVIKIDGNGNLIKTIPQSRNL